MKHPKQQGLSLIELLVALAIGGFLIIGAVTVQSQTRKTFSVNEAQARLQETARFALSVIEPDAQLAGLMGFSNDLAGTKFDAGDGTEPVAAKLMSTKLGAVAGAASVFNECGTNFVMDVNQPIQAEDGAWKLGCAAGGTGYQPGTDTLTIRRASVEKVAPEAGRLQVFSRRLLTDDSLLFASGVVPTVAAVKDDEAEVRDFIMKTYYVSPDADGRPNLPSLRIKQIIAKAGAGAWDDQELVRGVEDIQVELGVDPGADMDADGVIDMENGVATSVNGDVGRYVKPGEAVITSGQVVAVRLWIRVRAEEAEPGFVDRRSYKYASVDFQPNDGFRRVLMSRTIFIRNSRVFPSS